MDFNDIKEATKTFRFAKTKSAYFNDAHRVHIVKREHVRNHIATARTLCGIIAVWGRRNDPRDVNDVCPKCRREAERIEAEHASVFGIGEGN